MVKQGTMKYKRHKWLSKFYHAKCRYCDFDVDSRNAVGLAAQHFNKYNHSIDIEMSGSIMFLNDKDNKEQEALKRGA